MSETTGRSVRGPRTSGVHDVYGTGIDELDGLRPVAGGPRILVYVLEGQFYYDGRPLTQHLVEAERLEVVSSVPEIWAEEEAGNTESARHAYWIRRYEEQGCIDMDEVEKALHTADEWRQMYEALVAAHKATLAGEEHLA